jgi:hypothetical protein
MSFLVDILESRAMSMNVRTSQDTFLLIGIVFSDYRQATRSGCLPRSVGLCIVVGIMCFPASIGRAGGLKGCRVLLSPVIPNTPEKLSRHVVIIRLNIQLKDIKFHNGCALGCPCWVFSYIRMSYLVLMFRTEYECRDARIHSPVFQATVTDGHLHL